MTPYQIREARRVIEWKANLYALAAEVLADADAGDPLALRMLARVGLVERLRIVEKQNT
ncbi:hypothetical protein SSTU70S_00367 [Stutzerimonas stutzeri]